MAAPWEKYTSSGGDGPWAKYASAGGSTENLPTGISMPTPQGLQGPQTPGYWNQVWTRFSGQDPKFNPQIDPVQQQKFATEHPILNGIGQVVNHPMLQDPMLLGLPSEGAGAGIAATAKRALGLGAGIGTGIGVRHLAKSAGLGETVSDLMGTAAAGLITKKLSPEDAATVEGLLKNKGVGAARSFLSKFLTPETSLERMTPPAVPSAPIPPVQGSSLARMTPAPTAAAPVPPIQKEAGISPVNPTQPAPSGIKPVTAAESPVTIGPPEPVTGLHRPDVPPHYSGHVTQDAAYGMDKDLSKLVAGKTPDEIRALSFEDYNALRKQRAEAQGIKPTEVKPKDFETRREQLAKTHALELLGK